jgi:hypothetical protein
MGTPLGLPRPARPGWTTTAPPGRCRSRPEGRRRRIPRRPHWMLVSCPCNGPLVYLLSKARNPIDPRLRRCPHLVGADFDHAPNTRHSRVTGRSRSLTGGSRYMSWTGRLVPGDSSPVSRSIRSRCARAHVAGDGLPPCLIVWRRIDGASGAPFALAALELMSRETGCRLV